MKQGIFSGRLLRAAGILAVLALTFGSCMRDELDDCPPPHNVRLRVITDYEKAEADRTRGTYHQMDTEEFARHREGWYQDQIDNVSVYVFDQDDRFISSWRGPKYLLGEDYTVPFTLQEGKSYHFVAWTNSGTGGLYSPSLLLDEHTMASRGDMHMGLELPDDRTLTEEMAHRHFGSLENRPVFSGINDEEIVITPNTYRVNFIVRGLAAANANSYEVKVTDRNARHAFDGAHIEGEDDYFHTRTLSAGTTRAAGERSASMVLLQIGDDTDTSFELSNTTLDRSLHGGDLLQAIQTAYSEQIGPDKTFADMDDMLENKYEYDIILTNTAAGVKVEVHPWNYKGNHTHL